MAGAGVALGAPDVVGPLPGDWCCLAGHAGAVGLRRQWLRSLSGSAAEPAAVSADFCRSGRGSVGGIILGGAAGAGLRSAGGATLGLPGVVPAVAGGGPAPAAAGCRKTC